jgi:hypothetical protein
MMCVCLGLFFLGKLGEDSDSLFSLMSKMISLLVYGKHIGLNARNSGNAHWSKDK